MFTLNGKRVLRICNTLHAPGLAVPLYSLCAHLHQRGCGFIGTFKDGFHIYFPFYVLSVDMSFDCHLTYDSLGKAVPLGMLHYIQPWCPQKLYPSEALASSSVSTPQDSHPVMIEDDDNGTIAMVPMKAVGDVGPSGQPTVSLPSEPPESPTTEPTIDLGRISGRLDSLTCFDQHCLPCNAGVPSIIPPSLTRVNNCSITN